MTRTSSSFGPLKRNLISKAAQRWRRRRTIRAPRLRAAVPASAHSEAPPIFILGCHRSGTSLLRRVLDSHPTIACPPESKFVLPVTSLLRDTRAIRGLETMGYDRAAVVTALRGFVRSFFDTYAVARGRVRWADKTPNYVDCLPELWELFPDARYLLIVRHGLDVARSLALRDFPAVEQSIREAGGNKEVGAGLYWRKQNEKIASFQQEHSDSCLQLRYEELTTNAEAMLVKVFEFIGEPWDPRVLEFNRFAHHGGFEDPDIDRRRHIEPNSGRYREWPEPLQQAVAEACEPMLEQLGYRL